jgi:cell division cycle 2-like protein
MASRWVDDEADKAEAQRRKQEKEDKKRLKQQKAEQAAAEQEAALARPAKRRRLSTDSNDAASSSAAQPSNTTAPPKLLRFTADPWAPCRHSTNFETLNAIEEGSYGWVSRARDVSTSAVVALKKVKMDDSHDGFPITALREIAILQKARHPNIVALHEVLTGADPAECVLVLEFVEHDLKTLQDDMRDAFVASEVKTLLRQMAAGLAYLHANNIMHRDLKTSNILLSNRGALKLADFGMARRIPPPDAPLTQLVTTLWYRAPELLLGATSYGVEIDMWSLGAVLGELVLKTPLFAGSNEVATLSQQLTLCGLPTERTWPGFWRLPNAPALKLPREQHPTPSFHRAKFPTLSAAGVALLAALLSLNPDRRPSAEDVLGHPYLVSEQPRPKPAELFPTFPSRAGLERKRRASPRAPVRGICVEDGVGLK